MLKFFSFTFNETNSGPPSTVLEFNILQAIVPIVTKIFEEHLEKMFLNYLVQLVATSAETQ